MSSRRNRWLSAPWRDALGHFSSFKTICLLATMLPAIWMAHEVLSGQWDFPSPFVGLIYFSGLWTTYLLLVSLMVTPLRAIGMWPRLTQIRRILGVSCFFYGLLHLAAWMGLRFWNWPTLATELGQRPSLWFASVSILILLVLAATSFDAVMRAMGARWKLLHRLVYPAAILGVLHFLLSPGSIQGAPFLMAGLLTWGLGWRLLASTGPATSPVQLLALGLASTAVTLFLQPVWLMSVQQSVGASPWTALTDNLNPDVWQYLGVPPVWQMLAWTLATVSISVWRRAKILPNAISPLRPGG